MSRLRSELMQDGKFIGRILMVERICGMSIVDLRKEIKQLVIEKKLNIWNELVEKVNTDFDENGKEFWAFVGRKTKGKKKNIASLKSETGMSIISTRGKLEVLQKHYQLLSKMSLDSEFDADWKEVEDSVRYVKKNGVASVPVPGLNILLLEYRYQ